MELYSALSIAFARLKVCSQLHSPRGAYLASAATLPSICRIVLPMRNSNLDATWRYHNGTKHSYQSVRSNLHNLDWHNRPRPFKVYPNLDAIPLPRQVPQTGVPALSAISSIHGENESAAVPDINALALLLHFSAGVTKEKRYPGGTTFFFRAAACTGALYEFELYLVCGNLPGLEAGVYHFGVTDFSLRRLRRGDWLGVLNHATGDEPAILRAPLVIVCAGTYWRNAWKYRARTYRHFGWDNGTIIANLLAMCAALRLSAEVVMGFVDEEVNRLLDLDSQREVTFSMVAVGRTLAEPPASPDEVPLLGFETVPLSRTEVDYPTMREMHAASSLASVEDVRAWRGKVPAKPLSAPDGHVIRLEPSSDCEMRLDNTEQVILRRASTRQFARESITFEQLSTLLDRATRGVPADFLDPVGGQLNDMYLIVNAVEGLSPGAYFFRREEGSLELLKEGDFREQAAYLGLEQELPGDASVAVFFLGDLQSILGRFGNRGYRATQLEAGILGGKLYLAAYAQRLGATGLTFFDDDVTNFFSPHAAGKSAIFLTAIGKSARRSPPAG
jgi:SagB-type dehydrogenase family enzyme